MILDPEKFIGEGLTYDDVLLVPRYSEVMPREVDISSLFSLHIKINIPIVSAAMDTVTGSKLAIAIAQEGGIGVLHKNMPVQEQALEVKKVKRAESGMIINPIVLDENALVGDAIALMKEHQIGGIPVINQNKQLVGIVTNRDLRFQRDPSKPVREIMTKDNLITTTEFVTFEKASDILQEHKIEKLPVVDKNRKLIGLITYKDIMKIKARPNACKDSKGRLRVAAAIGIASDTIDRVQALYDQEVDAVVIDTAHAHTKGVVEMAKTIPGP
jgi:IMP dehydrogenase